MILRKLANQTVIYGLSTIIPKVINYLLTPYLTYIALNESDFGVIGYFYAVIPFAFSILLLGMENGFFRFTGKDNANREKVFTTVWSTSTLLATIFFLLALLFSKSIYNVSGGGYHISIIYSVAAIILFDVIAAIPFAKLREGERAMRFTIIKAASVVVNVIMVIFFYSLLPMLKTNPLFSWLWIEGYGAGYFFIANVLSSGFALIMVLFSVGRLKLSIDKRLLQKVLLFSVPLFIGGLAGTANEFMDRFLVRYLMPKDIALEQLGIYSATLKLTAIMVIFTQMYRYAAEPLFLAKLKSEEFKDNNAIVTLLFIVVSIIIFLFITLFLDIFQYIVAPEFREALDIVPLLLISSILLGVLLNLNFWYKYVEKTYFAIIITIIGFAVSISLNIILIPSIGLMGAALAKLSSSHVMVIVSYYFNQRYYPINYPLVRIFEYVIIAAVIYFGVQYIEITNQWLNYGLRGSLIALFTFYAIKRENLLLLLKKNY